MRRLYVLLASVVIAALLLAVASGASAAPMHRPPYYGALLVSPSLQDSYWASAGTKDRAVELALHRECRIVATDCTPGVWVRNGYAAFAMDPARAWGTGWGHTNHRLCRRP